MRDIYTRIMITLIHRKGGDIMAKIDLGNVKGDRGATGATGPQGPKGDTGATGPQGPEGSLPSSFIVSFSDGTSANGTYTET